MPLKVLVTGGGRGIGRAVALRFAQAGAAVTVAARTSAQIDAVAKEIDARGGRGMAANMNVVDHGSIEAAVWRAVEFMGGAIDVLVNCAGAFQIKPFDKMRPQDFNFVLETNLIGPFQVTMECLEYLQESERAHVFNFCAQAGRQAQLHQVAFSASKAGLRGLSDALRLDLAKDKIGVTTVHPPQVNTPMWDDVEAQVDRSKMIAPEVVAEAIYQAYASGNPPHDLEIPGRG
jgi:NAD(P)-dependent dehydrogenase (short-subunit alcohol dehydrogenase family)